MALRDYMQDLMRTQNASEISLINDNSSSSTIRPEIFSRSNHSNQTYTTSNLSFGDDTDDLFDGHDSFSSLQLSSHNTVNKGAKRDDNNPDTDEDAIYNDSMGSEDSFSFNLPPEDTSSDEKLIEGIRIRRGSGRRSSVRQMMNLPSDDGTNDDELGVALKSFHDRHRRLRESLHDNSSFHSPTNKLSPTTTTSQSTPLGGGESKLSSRLAQLSTNDASLPPGL